MTALIATPTPTVEVDPAAVALSIVVPGDPVSKARPRSMRLPNGRIRTYTPDDVTAAEQLIALLARRALAGAPADAASAFGVALGFQQRTRHRRDLDNLAKLVLDALNGVVWKDDSQVLELHVRLYRGAASPRTSILAYRIEEPSL